MCGIQVTWACFENSIFFQSKYFRPHGTLMLRTWRGHLESGSREERWLASMKTTYYRVFNCSNFITQYWNWNYCGCWHQNCCKWMMFFKGLKVDPFQLLDLERILFCFFISTTLGWEWVICVPGAFFIYSSHFSGTFSKIKPSFPITHGHHDRHGDYHWTLMEQMSKWVVTTTGDMGPARCYL